MGLLRVLTLCVGLIAAQASDARAAASGFGELPSGLNKAEFLRWIAPKEDPSLVFFAGAKAWGKDGKFVSAACFAIDNEMLEVLQTFGVAVCRGSEVLGEDSGTRLYLGVFRFVDGKLIPVARSKAPVNEFVKIEEFDGEEVMLEYRRLDLADFRLNEQESAFGVWGVYEEDYTIGSAYWELLQTFRVVGDGIVRVFSEEMYSRHENGDKISELKSTLHVLKTKTNGFFDWELRSSEGGKTKYSYSGGAYSPN